MSCTKVLSVQQDKRIIREIKFPKEELEVIQRIKDSKYSDNTKLRIASKLTGGLCSCGKIPSHEVIKGGKKLLTITEHYCQDCLKKEYSIFH